MGELLTGFRARRDRDRYMEVVRQGRVPLGRPPLAPTTDEAIIDVKERIDRLICMLKRLEVIKDERDK